MQSTSKYELTDMIRFVERQIVFTIETTAKVHTYHEFLLSQDSMVLFNSTCMCLQSIGEVIKQVDDRTKGKLFSLYPTTPWKKVIGMRNIISREYLIHRPSGNIRHGKESSSPPPHRYPSDIDRYRCRIEG